VGTRNQYKCEASQLKINLAAAKAETEAKVLELTNNQETQRKSLEKAARNKDALIKTLKDESGALRLALAEAQRVAGTDPESRTKRREAEDKIKSLMAEGAEAARAFTTAASEQERKIQRLNGEILAVRSEAEKQLRSVEEAAKIKRERTIKELEWTRSLAKERAQKAKALEDLQAAAQREKKLGEQLRRQGFELCQRVGEG
jgi:hypothetical protein